MQEHGTTISADARGHVNIWTRQQGTDASLLPDHLPPAHFQRSRLVDLVERPRQARVTLITAGAGYGKTTFAIEWMGQSALCVGWLTLSERDEEPLYLVSHLRAALRAAQQTADAETHQIRHADGPFEGDVALLKSEIASAHQDVCLILDNCERLQNPACVDVLNDVIAHLPARFFLMLLGRRSLPLRLGRLRAQGCVRQIGQDELRLTEEESKHALLQLANIDMDDSDVRRIWAAAEGWISGIRLLGMSFRGVDGSPYSHADSLLKRNAFLDEYVREELLDPLTPAIQEFVLQTAELPFLSADLCDALLDRDDSASMLAEMRRGFAFLTQVVDHPDRLRYHHLVRESVRRMVGLEMSEQSRDVYRRRAVTWLLSAGDLEAAADLALDSPDAAWTSEMTRPLCRHLAERSRFEALSRRISLLSAEAIACDAEYLYWQAICKLGLGRTIGVAELLDSAESIWREAGNSRSLGWVALCRGMLGFFTGDDQSTQEWLSQALASLPPPALTERLYAATFLGKLSFREGRDEDAVSQFAVAETYATRLPLDEQWAWRYLGPDRGNAYALRGDLASAMTKFRMLLSEMPPVQRNLEGILRCRLISLAIERNDLETALDELEIVERLIAEGRSEGYHDAVVARARFLLAAGERDAAEQWGVSHVKELRRLPEKNQLVLLLARIWLERGELSLVRSWLSDVNSLAFPWVQTFGDINYRALAIDLALAEEHFEEAARLAEMLTAEAAATRRWSEFIEFSVRWAIALQQLGHQAQSRQVLRPAMERGVKGGFVRAFHVPGFDVTWLFADLWSESRESMRVKRSLHDVVDSAVGPHASTLSKREIEVLLLVAQGRSNQQIANDMFISVNTVRNHLVKICRRLGASSRTEAVAVAREQGLLD